MTGIVSLPGARCPAGVHPARPYGSATAHSIVRDVEARMKEERSRGWKPRPEN